MCIVIDINTLSAVFKGSDAQHSEFSVVRKWILESNGKIVFGGTKYKSELSHLVQILKLINLLSSLNKVVKVNDENVDEEVIRLNGLENHPDFDDAHILAILNVSECKLLCSKDKRSFQFIKNTKLRKSGLKPKIYSSVANEDLLCNENISDVCLPCCRLPKKTFAPLMKLLEKKP